MLGIGKIKNWSESLKCYFMKLCAGAKIDYVKVEKTHFYLVDDEVFSADLDFVSSVGFLLLDELDSFDLESDVLVGSFDLEREDDSAGLSLLDEYDGLASDVLLGPLLVDLNLNVYEGFRMSIFRLL